MNIGIYEKALPASLSWKEKFLLANDAGYNFIEMSIDESDERLSRLDWNTKDIHALKRCIEDTALSIPTMCLSGHRRFPLGSREKNIREKAIDISKKAIALAYELGIRVIQVAGYDVYYEESGKDTHEYFIEGLSRSLDIASQAQVCLGIEIMDHHYINSIRKFKDIFDIIPSAWLKVYPDIGNIWAWQPNSVLEDLQVCPELIVGMHLKDILTVKKDFAGQFRDLVLGEGEVDFVKAFQYLTTIRYRGPFLIEMWLKEGEEYRLSQVREWVIQKMKEAHYYV